MLKSTYAPPPPLPPGWTEHKAPSGQLRLTLVVVFLTKHQAICIITTLRRSNPPIRDRNPFLHRPSRLQRAPKAFKAHRLLLQRRYHRSLRHRTRRKDMDMVLVFPGIIINKVQHGEGFVVEKGTRTANLEGQRTGQNQSMLYPHVNRGCS